MGLCQSALWHIWKWPPESSLQYFSFVESVSVEEDCLTIVYMYNTKRRLAEMFISITSGIILEMSGGLYARLLSSLSRPHISTRTVCTIDNCAREVWVLISSFVSRPSFFMWLYDIEKLEFAGNNYFYVLNRLSKILSGCPFIKYRRFSQGHIRRCFFLGGVVFQKPAGLG